MKIIERLQLNRRRPIVMSKRALSLYLAGQRIGWVSAATIFPVSNAFAQKDPSVFLKNICDFILGPFGQSLAVLGIIAIGVSWMFGRASLGLIAGVIGGIVIMFGASYIGQKITA